MRIQAKHRGGHLEVLVEYRPDLHVDLDLVVAAVHGALSDALTDTPAPAQPAVQDIDAATPGPRDVATPQRRDAEPEDAEPENAPADDAVAVPDVAVPDPLERVGCGVRSLERELRPRALELLDDGVPETEVCARLGITRTLLARWDDDPDPDPGPAAPAGRILTAAAGAR